MKYGVRKNIIPYINVMGQTSIYDTIHTDINDYIPFISLNQGVRRLIDVMIYLNCYYLNIYTISLDDMRMYYFTWV